MQRRLLLAASVMGLLLPSPVVAGPAPMDDNSILVVSPSLEAWSERVFKDLNRQIRYPSSLAGMPVHTGIVAVKFNASETGSPAGIELQKSSGHRDLDYATMRAVKRIPTLHPLPRGLTNGQKYIVRVLFADSIEDLRTQTAQMRAEAARSNAWFTRGSNIATLEIVPLGG
ncbi:energy transducer TonB [Novosphingobium sp. BL-52-GroH]|uniref:energy transducer TonB family protein n=1 Tax=Novosphingobium sp. BL-52-GroH TaxID=3349877 RepID=UPI00384E2E90